MAQAVTYHTVRVQNFPKVPIWFRQQKPDENETLLLAFNNLTLNSAIITESPYVMEWLVICESDADRNELLMQVLKAGPVTVNDITESLDDAQKMMYVDQLASDILFKTMLKALTTIAGLKKN